MKDPGQVIVNLLPPESHYDLAIDNPNEKTDDLLDKPIIPPVVRLSTPYHSDIGDSGIESGSESDFSQRNIIFSHRNPSKSEFQTSSGIPGTIRTRCQLGPGVCARLLKDKK